MSKYSQSIAALAAVFSLKAVIFTDWPSVVIAVAFIALHVVDLHLESGAEKLEQKIEARLQASEDTLKNITTDVSTLKIQAGFKSIR